MPIHAVRSTIDTDVVLHVEEAGLGEPILFIHEFAGDHRSWEPQLRHFSRSYRCLTYSARGYPPSSVPPTISSYSQGHAVQDAIDILDQLGVAPAHIVGLSMGGFCALHLALQSPARVRSVTIGGVGYGAGYDAREAFQAECEVIAAAFETEGARDVAPRYARGPARVQFENKDPRGHSEFLGMLGQHSSLGSALTMRGFQKERPSLYDFSDQLEQLQVPLLILLGDEDDGAIDASIMLKRTVATAGLAVSPRSGHTLNLEEPMWFNSVLGRFLTEVTAGSWLPRDPRSRSVSTTGMTDDA